MAGSRPGAIIAGAWSALMVIGKQGYVDSCREIVGARREIEAAVRYQIPEVTVMGRPLVSIIAFQSDVVDILEVGDRMSKLGWHRMFHLSPHTTLVLMMSNSHSQRSPESSSASPMLHQVDCPECGYLCA